MCVCVIACDASLVFCIFLLTAVCIDCGRAGRRFQAQLSPAPGDHRLSIKYGRSRGNRGTVSAGIRANLFAAQPPSAQDGATWGLMVISERHRSGRSFALIFGHFAFPSLIFPGP